MLDRQLVIGASNRAFQQAPDVLDPVRMHVATDVLFGAMVHDFVLRVMVSNSSIGSPIVGNDDFCIWGCVVLNEIVEGLPIRAVDDLQSNFPASLNHTDHNCLVFKIGPTSQAMPPEFSADKCFVTFHRAIQWRGVQFCHGCTDAMAEVPCGFVRHSEDTFHLIGRHAFLGFDGKIDGNEPLAERQVGIMPNGARCH